MRASSQEAPPRECLSGAFAGSIKDHADKIVIPPLASLLHDAKFFADIKGRGFHQGLLDGLKGFYP